MSNLNEPAYPIAAQGDVGYGLTKRERACIDLRVPESGDEELDELIRMANRRESLTAMTGALVSNGSHEMTGEQIFECAYHAAERIEEALNNET